MNKKNTQKNLFPIGELAKLTGVNSITLRAWERRYGLLKPQRDKKGHRLYGEDDIRQVQAILAYMDQGIAVSKVKELLVIKTITNAKQQEIMQQARALWQSNLDHILIAIESFSITQLDAVYNEINSLYPIDVVTQRLLLPLFNEFKRRRKAKKMGSIAQEQFFMAYIRSKLGSIFCQLVLAPYKKQCLLACLPSEKNELKLLLFAIDLMRHGYGVTFLAAPISVEEILYVATKRKFYAIILSGNLTEENCRKLAKEKDNHFFCFSKRIIANKKNLIMLNNDFNVARQIL